jgi:hypothetical protein
MRRVFLAGSMAVLLLSCANSGNGSNQQDSSTSTQMPTNPGDTIHGGYGADAHTDVGAGTGTGPGTGAGAAGGNTSGVGAGTGGAGTNADTTAGGNRRQQ